MFNHRLAILFDKFHIHGLSEAEARFVCKDVDARKGGFTRFDDHIDVQLSDNGVYVLVKLGQPDQAFDDGPSSFIYFLYKREPGQQNPRIINQASHMYRESIAGSKFRLVGETLEHTRNEHPMFTPSVDLYSLNNEAALKNIPTRSDWHR